MQLMETPFLGDFCKKAGEVMSENLNQNDGNGKIKQG